MRALKLARHAHRSTTTNSGARLATWPDSLRCSFAHFRSHLFHLIRALRANREWTALMHFIADTAGRVLEYDMPQSPRSPERRLGGLRKYVAGVVLEERIPDEDGQLADESPVSSHLLCDTGRGCSVENCRMNRFPFVMDMGFHLSGRCESSRPSDGPVDTAAKPVHRCSAICTSLPMHATRCRPRRHPHTICHERRGYPGGRGSIAALGRTTVTSSAEARR